MFQAKKTLIEIVKEIPLSARTIQHRARNVEKNIDEKKKK